jgi:malate dehydrogenase
VHGVERMVVWGNHSPTMFADWRFATAGGKLVSELAVAQRGTAVLNARGASSAASAANAAIDHMRDWLHGTNGRWVSMGIASNGSYGIPEGLICGVPVTCTAGAYNRVDGLAIDDFARRMIDRTVAELKEELAAVKA